MTTLVDLSFSRSAESRNEQDIFGINAVLPEAKDAKDYTVSQLKNALIE